MIDSAVVPPLRILPSRRTRIDKLDVQGPLTQ